MNALSGNAFSTAFSFTSHVLGKEFLEDSLGVPETTYSRPASISSRHLGFTAADIEAADLYACGTMTIEGAPHLKTEHYAVFDTATPNGKIGKRSIPWKAHIEMMAAVQPFISGAISKTINMPVHGHHRRHQGRLPPVVAQDAQGHRAVPRRLEAEPAAVLAHARLGCRRRRGACHHEGFRATRASAWPSLPRAGQEAEPAPGQTLRLHAEGEDRRPQHLPAHRPVRGRDRSGRYSSTCTRKGAAFRSLLNSFAIAVSLGLQYGVPLEEYVDAFTFTRFEPNGMVSGHDHIKMTTSVLDLIFRDLALSYLGRTDLVQVKPDDLIATTMNRNNGHRDDASHNGHGEVVALDNEVHVAKMKGYEGDPCPSAATLPSCAAAPACAATRAGRPRAAS